MVNRNTYNKVHRFSSIAMILALLWLTISAPFVLASQQYFDSYHASAGIPQDSSEEESTNPFGNNTEEKAPSGNSFSEEYLHDHDRADDFFFVISRFHKCENAGTYIAYHGELLVPPPNVA